MNRGEGVILHYPLAHHDGILEIVAVPGCKGNHGIHAQGQPAVFSGHTVGKYVALFHLVSHGHNGLLVNTGILVRTFELPEGINIFPVEIVLVAVGFYNNSACIHMGYFTGPFGKNQRSAVPGGHLFHTGSNHRIIGVEKGHCLTLHVGTHQGPVGVIVFQEGYQSG